MACTTSRVVSEVTPAAQALTGLSKALAGPVRRVLHRQMIGHLSGAAFGLAEAVGRHEEAFAMFIPRREELALLLVRLEGGQLVLGRSLRLDGFELL